MENEVQSAESFNHIVIWLDVSKSKLDIFDYNESKSSIIKNNCSEIKKYIKSYWEKNKNKLTFVFEPTWIYSHHLVKALNDLEINYFQIWLDVISKLGYALWDRNKNDKVDAKKIASVWRMMVDYSKDDNFKIKTIWKIPNELLVAKNLLSQYYSIKNVAKTLKQLVDSVESQAFKKELLFIKTWYLKQIKEHEKQEKIIVSKLEEFIKDMWYEDNKNFIKTIPWIAESSAISLTIFFLDLMSKWIKRNDLKKVKAYTGLDPQNSQSWSTLKKTKISKRWNKNIRMQLFLPTMTWMKHLKLEKYQNTTIWKFATRMNQKFIVNENWKRVWWKRVICAIEAKLIITAWAIFWDKKEYSWS